MARDRGDTDRQFVLVLPYQIYSGQGSVQSITCPWWEGLKGRDGYCPRQPPPATSDETDNWHETYILRERRTGIAIMPVQSYLIFSTRSRRGEWRPRLTDLSLQHFWHVRDNDGTREREGDVMMMYESSNWHDWEIIYDREREREEGRGGIIGVRMWEWYDDS